MKYDNEREAVSKWVHFLDQGWGRRDVPSAQDLYSLPLNRVVNTIVSEVEAVKTTETVEAALTNLGLSNYMELFCENGINEVRDIKLYLQRT